MSLRRSVFPVSREKLIRISLNRAA